MALPPTALATAVCSPFGSPGTYTRRPNGNERVYSDFARLDFPEPTIPANTMLGAVMMPLAYKTQGS
jgi:hypothetical protein